MKEMLQWLEGAGPRTQPYLCESYGVKLVKEAVLRGLIKVSGEPDNLVMEITERGKRIAAGLPGEEGTSNTFEIPLRELIQEYLKTRPGKPHLAHFGLRDKEDKMPVVIITVSV